MADRVELQRILEGILGSRQVYFQPPASVSMRYPAIVYSLSDIDVLHANDHKYQKNKRYMVTLIDKNPDSVYVDPILDLPLTSFDRSYAAENLNHFVFTIYF